MTGLFGVRRAGRLAALRAALAAVPSGTRAAHAAKFAIPPAVRRRRRSGTLCVFLAVVAAVLLGLVRHLDDGSTWAETGKTASAFGFWLFLGFGIGDLMWARGYSACNREARNDE